MEAGGRDAGRKRDGPRTVAKIVNAARIPPRPDQGPTTCDWQPAMVSKLHKTTELLISQVFYRQSNV